MDTSAEEHHHCDSHKSITSQNSEVGLVLHPFVPRGPYPQQTHCTYCHHRVPTRTRIVVGNMTWMVCCGICLVGGFFLCCCLVPFCIDDLKDCEHYCGNCNIYLGTFKRF
uniref:LITAF domain-containing protein n=1 Tax=Globodera pallida TaxID=36090 RepID=A0A183CFZ9_GLOPA